MKISGKARGSLLNIACLKVGTANIEIPHMYIKP